MTLLKVFLVALVLSLIPVIYVAIRAFFRYRGTRLITCPETKMPAAVRIDKGHAAASTAVGNTDLRLESCTRWPQREHCGQECLSQIAAAPDGCLVRSLLVRWYDGAFCDICREPIGAIHWGDNKPVLLAPDGKTREWDDIRPETLPTVLATHKPVCWSCHVAKTFHDLHPELVTERKAHSERRAS
jgi:hypothetical protein